MYFQTRLKIVFTRISKRNKYASILGVKRSKTESSVNGWKIKAVGEGRGTIESYRIRFLSFYNSRYDFKVSKFCAAKCVT